MPGHLSARPMPRATTHPFQTKPGAFESSERELSGPFIYACATDVVLHLRVVDALERIGHAHASEQVFTRLTDTVVCLHSVLMFAEPCGV